MKYTIETFRALVDTMMVNSVGLTSSDLPDVSLWDYFDTDTDYTKQEITEAARDAIADILMEGDCPFDVIDDTMTHIGMTLYQGVDNDKTR
jgi:hypothetical protein